MLAQKVLIWMDKQKTPKARRVIVSVETFHAKSHHIRRSSETIITILIMVPQLGSFCDAILYAPCLQLLGFKFVIAFIVITHINPFHKQGAVINMAGEGLFKQMLDFNIFHHTALHG
jgi:hypothetical protein